MIITITRKRNIGDIEITDTASIEVQNRESTDVALNILWRIRDRWTRPDTPQDKENQDER